MDKVGRRRGCRAKILAVVGGGMATVEQPLTRSDLRSELDSRFQHYATKADLANLRAELIAKIDGMLWKFAGISVTVGALIVGALRLWLA